LGKRDEWQFDGARSAAGTAHMPICLCCGEDVDFAQDYRPVLPFCSHCVSERCRKCRSQVRVRKFQQDPTFNLIGRPQGPRMKCGWGCGGKLTGRDMRAHFTICPKRPAGSHGRSSKIKRGRPPGPRMKCGLGLWRTAHGEPDAAAFHGMPRAAERLRAAKAALFQSGARRCATSVRGAANEEREDNLEHESILLSGHHVASPGRRCEIASC
jgi:hypothetical protein